MKHINLNLSGVILLIALGVLLPVLLSTAVGIIALVIAKDSGGIVTSVLVISFAVTALGSALVTVFLTGRKARLARRQEDFVANVSHDFRTPLSVIRLYTQTLQSGKLDSDSEEMNRCLDTIVRETEWLDAMIDRVLTWRAAARDMIPLDFTVEPVTGAVQHAADRFQSMVSPEDLTLTLDIDSQCAVRHDQAALQMVVLNLLTNAYKYTGREKQIHLSVKDADSGVVIEVQDNGMGVQTVEKKRIFQPFYRTQNAKDHATGGVGLGLAIVTHLVKQHKGSLTVHSEKGQGATFVVFLPAAQGSP